jgi:CBS domain-containing protein
MTTESPPPRTRLREIMLKRYLRLGESHTIAEVMGFLSDARFQTDGLPYLVVINREGGMAGMLPPKAVFRALLGDATGSQAKPDEAAFRDCVNERLQLRVGRIMQSDIPQLGPDASLIEAFHCVRETAADVVAVIEEGRVVGLLTARILFETAAQLTVGSLSGGVIPPAVAGGQTAPGTRG